MKIFAFIIAVCTAIAAVPAHADIRRCTAMSTNVSSCSVTPGHNVDWLLNCGSFRYAGVGICSSKSGTQGDSFSGDLPRSNAENTKYCWCKMLYPGQSLWFFVNMSSSYQDCVYGCGMWCENILRSSSETILRNMLQSAITLE